MTDTFSQEDFDKLVAEGVIPKEDLEGVVPPGQPTPPAPPAPPALDLTAYKLDGDNIPPELKGKTLDQALSAYNEIRTLSTNLAKDLAARTNQPTQPATPPTPPKAPEFSPEDLVDNSAKGFNEKMDQFFTTKTAPLMAMMAQNSANMNRMSALQRSEVLREYEGTLNQIINENQLNEFALAQPQTWAVLEAMVQQRHMQDIVKKQVEAAARRPAPEPSFTPRNAPEGGSPTLTAEQLEIARGLGIDPRVYATMVQYTNQG